MAIDPTAAGIVEAMTAVFPPLGTEVFDAAEARRIQAAAPRAEIEPIPVARTEDRTIPGPAGPLPVRLYWPEAATAAPFAAFFHGGGFAICDLDTHDRVCRALCSRAGAMVMSVDYRLAPEHRYPAAADDAFAAVAWAYENAAALGGDPERLAVAGDSAGGNLAAVACLAARDRGGPPIAAQLLIYPVTDAGQDTASYRDHAEGGFLTADHMRWFWQQYLADPAEGAQPMASPLRAQDLSRLPPACVITAECDPLRDEGEAYAARLTTAGVPVTARRFDGMFHGFFGMDNVLPAAAEAQDLAAKALNPG